MIHNTCNIAVHDLPEIYARSRGLQCMPEGHNVYPQPLDPWPSGFRHTIRQIPHGHVATITCITLRGDSINGGMAEMAETVGFQFSMFIATLILYEYLYSIIIA